MKKGLLLLGLVPLLLTSCKKEEKSTFQSFTCEGHIKGFRNNDKTAEVYVDPFDTSMIIRYYMSESERQDETLKNKIIDTYSDEIIRLHKIFDRHYYYFDDNGELITNLKVLNDSYGSGEEVIVPIELYELLKFSISTYDLTEGMFNIFTGSLTDYWEEKFEAVNECENQEEFETIEPYFCEEEKNKLEKIVESIPNTKNLYESQLTFNDANHSVIFNKLGECESIPYISLGGVAKGYATDLVKEKLINEGLTKGVLFSGGSSLSSLSDPCYSDSQKNQKIQVKDPSFTPSEFNKIAFTLTVDKEYNFSTSGDYTTDKHYWFINNDNERIIRHHIINPFSGYPMNYSDSVSILSYNISGAYMDILSTTLMNLSVSDGSKIRDKLVSLDMGIDIAYLHYEDNQLILREVGSIPYLTLEEGVIKK